MKCHGRLDAAGMQNPRCQTPNPKQNPYSKSQRRGQANGLYYLGRDGISVLSRPLGNLMRQLWALGFGIFLGFGVWDLGFKASGADTAAVATATNDTLAATNRIDAVEQRRGRFGGPERGIYKAQIAAHWFQNNTRFWYRNDLRDEAKEFILVDAEKGRREPAFDHQKLAAALSKAAGEQFSPARLPFSSIDFLDSGKALQFEAAGKTWRCDLESYECKPVQKSASAEPAQGTRLLGEDPPRHGVPASAGGGLLTARDGEFWDATEWAPFYRLKPGLQTPEACDNFGISAAKVSFGFEPTDSLRQLLASPSDDEIDPPSPLAEPDPADQPQSQTSAQSQDRNRTDRPDRAGDRRRSGDQSRPRKSPDGKWSASIKDYNVTLHSETDSADFQFTHDGKEGNAYSRLEWAPDSQALVAWRMEPGDHKEVYLIQSSPPGGGRALFKSRPYDLPGDKLNLYEPNVFDIASRKPIKPEVERFEHGWEAPSVHWMRDQRHFAYVQVDRGHQRYRLIEIDSRTGALRDIIDEKSATFIWTAHNEALGLTYVNWLTNSDEIIYASERDGWRHLYLIDIATGEIKNQITKGQFVVRGIDRIDEENRQIWFRAGGRNADQDPYFIQFYRVNFDGSGLVALTEGNGNHSIQYSPDRKYIIDTYSRIDLPPVHELRRVSDCGLVCQLETADISELKETGWHPSEVFVAKGRDGKTDIWGVITRPRDFDPAKKYPVIEQIYAGPQGSYTPKNFSSMRRSSSLTDLGFVVVQMDGMGTANRSKAFHDVCWKNLKDAGFPDRILWHKAVAAKYPWYDISRVGIMGTSAGGQNAAAAVIFHPEFYKAAVANSGCHDNRMDKASWNEQWMGYPVGPQYAECSNIENASKLGGALMLVVGEMDDNVPPETTYRFVDALIRANKDFDLLVVPNGGHGAGGAYGLRRLQDFFTLHLQGTLPPNRNAKAVQQGG
jgi:dienelactone hydrolase